jgi:hypothetical protein
VHAAQLSELAREVAKDQLIAIAYGHTAQLAATTLIEKTAIFCYSVPPCRQDGDHLRMDRYDLLLFLL